MPAIKLFFFNLLHTYRHAHKSVSLAFVKDVIVKVFTNSLQKKKSHKFYMPEINILTP